MLLELSQNYSVWCFYKIIVFSLSQWFGKYSAFPGCLGTIYEPGKTPCLWPCSSRGRWCNTEIVQARAGLWESDEEERLEVMREHSCGLLGKRISDSRCSPCKGLEAGAMGILEEQWGHVCDWSSKPRAVKCRPSDKPWLWFWGKWITTMGF